MDELNLESKTKNRQLQKVEIEQTLVKLLAEMEENSCESSTYVPDLIRNYFSLKKKKIEANFNYEKDRLSWPVISNSKEYGDWFNESPLEITPQLPQNAATQNVINLLRGVSKECFKEDGSLDHKRIFNRVFNPKDYYDGDRDERLYRQWIGLYLLSVDEDPWNRDELYTQGRNIHPDATVRALILSLVYFDLPWVPAEDYLYDCTHDTDEVVFIKAFRICGRIHDERSMDHLRPIVQSPSAVLKGLHDNKMYYPVGHAACNICPAQFAIIGTDNPQLAEQREQEMTKRLRRPLSVPVEHSRERLVRAIENFEQPAPPTGEPADFDKMIKIPAGEFHYGIDSNRVQNEVFDWTTCSPSRKMYLDEFYIDPYPVTNAEYDLWEEKFRTLSEKERRKFEHPGQKPNKPHRRNTYDDARFGSDHPVVGIDWFDAWAYARYHNKELATEYQWEKAAKGETTWRFPWGDHFEPGALRYAGETYKMTPSNIIEWIILLNKGTKSFPQSTTSPVNSHPKGRSPYGVYDLCGNAWEFTKTAFFTEKDARAPFSDFDPVELMGTREGHVVIRGGAWSSPAPIIGSSYRGYDLLTDRHTEITFRTVFNPNNDKTKKS